MKHAFYLLVGLALAANGIGCAAHRKCGSFCGHPGHCGNCGGCQMCGTPCTCTNGPCAAGCCDAGCARGGLFPRGAHCCTPRGGLFEHWWAGKHGGAGVWGHGGHGGGDAGGNPYADPYAGQMQAAPPQSAGAVAYPYYTTRGPRDFLINNPPSIGPY